jgi:hypothetical protein
MCRRAGPNGEDVPPIFIDRAGAKIGLVEQHSRNSKASLSLVLEQARISLPACNTPHYVPCTQR